MKNSFTSFYQKWLKLSSKEKLLSFLFLSSVIIGVFLLTSNFFYKLTELKPKPGGVLRFGVIGQPSYINPVLTQSNDCEKDLIELIYDGLYSVDGQGNLSLNLAEKTEISDDGRTYIVFLKDNVFWHDGINFTADDVIFTIETIQNPSIKSPLMLNWRGVVVEKLGKYVVRFNLKNAYRPFLQNLTLKIIPKHIWENIEIRNFHLAEYNLKPIGTGPYLFDNLQKNKSGKIISYALVANEKYFQKEPYISNITFRFFDNYESLKDGFLKKEIDAFAPLLVQDFEFFKNKKNIKVESIYIPRYYAVFLNLKNSKFNKELREALDLAIPRQELVKEILKNQAFPLRGPITPGFLKQNITFDAEYSPEKAREIIKHLDKDLLSFKLFLPNNLELIKVASFLANCWEKIGISAELEILPTSILEKEVIQTRSYDALLFGELIGQNPDLYSFWHSSQTTSPGLNLCFYENKELDKLLETSRQAFNEEEQIKDLWLIQEILAKEKPAIFLYNPFYLYILPKKVKGNNIQYANLSSEKFSDIENWYINTKRIIKKQK